MLSASATSLAASVYVGLFEMGASFVTWLLAMQTAKHVSRIANLIFLSPFISLLWINGVLGEQVLPSTLVGLAMILMATLWQQTQKN
jgi:drug/metabolite transporter (DMT)-like permease